MEIFHSFKMAYKMASLSIYIAAQRDQKLPRNDLPKPRPGGPRY